MPISRAAAVVGAACLLAADNCDAVPEDDAVLSLPGWGQPPTRQFAGFLDASAAEPGTRLFYWFAACERGHLRDCPTVLWLNGGPGSSSVLGMLQEQGPLLIDRDGGLVANPFSWTKVVNFFILESPAAVGHSYCRASLEGKPCSPSDNSTAAAAHAALVDFFGTVVGHMCCCHR